MQVSAFICREAGWNLHVFYFTGNLSYQQKMLEFSVVSFFDKIDQKIEGHRQDAEEHNAHDYHIQPENLASVDDQVAQSLPGADEFSDNNPHKTESNIDFHVA